MSDHSGSTEQQTDGDEAGSGSSGGAERILGALGRAAAEFGSREALTELGDRARAIVEELARSARSRATGPDTSSRPARDAEETRDESKRSGTASSDFEALELRLREIRASVAEVADVLDAACERLGVVERQLGDPSATTAAELSGAIGRCERVLGGIAYRVHKALDAGSGDAVEAGPVAASTVLVVAPDSARRARLCLLLEGQGFDVLAASGVAGALGAASRRPASAALLAIDAGATGFASLLEEWKEHEEKGTLPGALVLDAGGSDRASAFGFTTIGENDGDAAIAACLAGLTGAPAAPE